MAELKYSRAEKIPIKVEFSEKWVQDRIEEDPTILGLGELLVVERERRQSSGGRIDFLFLDPETQTMYETEIMLGSTDESHIIRTIEYWDIERRRFPTKDHKAVIVAEDITNRFFNVIALMNRSIPIIAIQLNALKIGDQVILNATKVLDIYEPPEDEEDLGLETVDRSYWENRSNLKSIAMMDEMIGIISEIYSDVRVTYNKHHVAIGTTQRNFIWFHPRKRAGYCHFDIKVGKNNLEGIKSLLEESGISFNHRKDDILSVSIQAKEFSENRKKLKDLFHSALSEFS